MPTTQESATMTDEDDDFIPFLGSPRPPRTPEQQVAHVAAVRRAVERMKARIAAAMPAVDVTVGKAKDSDPDHPSSQI